MRTNSILGAMAALLLLTGCGGGGGGGDHVGRGEVTGIVVDANGQPVRDARVYVDDHGSRETRSDTAGGYVLQDVAAVDLTVHARVSDASGNVYEGANLARVYTGESTPNVNLTVYPEDRIVSLVGRVTTSASRALGNVRVSARPTDAKVQSSASAVTDADGYYKIEGLASNVEYQVVASAQGYGDDSATVTIPTHPSTDQRTQDLVVKNVTQTAPDAPTGLFARAFTTPYSPTTRGGLDAAHVAAYQALKALRHPTAKGTTVVKRDTPNGNPITVDLTWDEPAANPTVRPHAYIVYRNEAVAVDNGFLLNDPLATLFSDSDVQLQVGTAYTYGLVAVSNDFTATDMIGRSAAATSNAATPLGDLLATSSDRTISWTAVAGATAYTVYVYDSVPRIGATPLVTQTTSGTSLTIDSASLVAGGSYVAIVVGQNADDSAEAFSDFVSVQPVSPPTPVP